MANPDLKIMPHVVEAARPMRSSPLTLRPHQSGQQSSLFPLHLAWRARLSGDRSQRRYEGGGSVGHCGAGTRRAYETLANTYGGEVLSFSTEHIIPKPFDPRLIPDIAPAVGKSAADTGDALNAITDVPAYHNWSVRYELDRLSLRDWTPFGVHKVSSSRGVPRWMSFLSDRT